MVELRVESILKPSCVYFPEVSLFTFSKAMSLITDLCSYDLGLKLLMEHSPGREQAGASVEKDLSRSVFLPVGPYSRLLNQRF